MLTLFQTLVLGNGFYFLLLTFADPDPAFHSDADPDPASQIDCTVFPEDKTESGSKESIPNLKLLRSGIVFSCFSGTSLLSGLE
jgi:hypothetical protein